MRILLVVSVVLSFAAARACAGPYAPAAGQPGSTAIANTSPAFVEWANGFRDLTRGPLDIAHPANGNVTGGLGGNAVGVADGTAAHVISLGDGGRITMTFPYAIKNGPGADLAVFENSFSDTFLELAFVEVSTNGTDFVRFPSDSRTPVAPQIGSFDLLDPTNLDGLAGKYRAGFGTPFDLSAVAGLSAAVDVNDIHYVRIIDVVGTIDSILGSRDSQGDLINDPYPTAFPSGGFDLNGVGVLNMVPEPGSWALLVIGGTLAAALGRDRQARRRASRDFATAAAAAHC